MSSPSGSSSMQAKRISLRTADGELFQVEEAVAMELEIVKTYFADNEDADEDMVVPLPNVMAETMATIVEYCKAHVEFNRRKPPARAEEVKAFDQAFVADFSNEKLKEMIQAANYLNVRKLLDCLTLAAAKRIQNKSVQYVRNFFGIENDFTPEEEAVIRGEYEWAFEGVDED